jgi:hypothetical protein
MCFVSSHRNVFDELDSAQQTNSAPAACVLRDLIMTVTHELRVIKACYTFN